MENYFSGRVVISDGIPLTNKDDKENHGYGIKSIINTVNKYHGLYNFSFKDDLFTTKIVLPKGERR